MATDHLTTEKLFVRENGGTIALNGLKQQILHFIKKGDPDAFPHVHDIRALATSINFMQHMQFDDLCNYTGWKSPGVFYKHYLKHVLSSLKNNPVKPFTKLM